jgi:hypothetical protein
LRALLLASSHWLTQDWHSGLPAGPPEQPVMQFILAVGFEAEEAQPDMQLSQFSTVCVGGQEQPFSWIQPL